MGSMKSGKRGEIVKISRQIQKSTRHFQTNPHSDNQMHVPGVVRQTLHALSNLVSPAMKRQGKANTMHQSYSSYRGFTSVIKITFLFSKYKNFCVVA